MSIDAEVTMHCCLELKMELVLCVAVAVVLGYLIYRFLKREKIYNDPPDTVILCQLRRGAAAPSFSPYPLKLETFLRMTNVAYKSVSDRGFSPKGKTPYIMFNGEKLGDSQLCIEFIKKKFNVDPDKNLSVQEKAVARAFRKMIEESTFWGLVLYRFVHHFNRAYIQLATGGSIPKIATYILNRRIRNQTIAQGMGRHSEKEITEMTLGDFEAISMYLGNKPFLMGREPSEVDCAVFGMLAQFRWQLPGAPYENAITETYPNLDAYLLRMKERFWPDWDECITHNGTKEATK